jgi:hypothetical protein
MGKSVAYSRDFIANTNNSSVKRVKSQSIFVKKPIETFVLINWIA